MQDLHSHFDLSLWVHYGELGGGAYQLGLHILYWMMQQFLYYLLERKFGQDLPLPDFLGLLHHVHTKTLDSFPGHLPASWMEQVHPKAHVLTNQDTTTLSWEPCTICNQGSPELVMNTNYMNSVKKHWLASGLSNLQTMFQVHS